MSTVINVVFEKKYIVEQELQDEILKTIHTFDDKLSIVSCIGVLEMIKHDLVEEAK